MAFLTGNKKKQVLELLKSGNFTIASHNYGQVSIYRGRFNGYTGDWSKNPEPDMPYFPGEEIALFNLSDSWGYMQEIVALLTEALGGSNGGSA